MSDYWSVMQETRPSPDELFGFNTDEISDVQWDNINYNDHPDYSDAFIVSAKYRGKDMTSIEIDLLMDSYQDWCYDNLIQEIF